MADEFYKYPDDWTGVVIPPKVSAEVPKTETAAEFRKRERAFIKAEKRLAKRAKRLGKKKSKRQTERTQYFNFNGKPCSFYLSQSWRELRYEALKLQGGACVLCGATAQSSGRPMHVDHIKPRSKHPELEFDLNNVQVLCEECNQGKGNSDSVDWRPKS